MRKAIIWAPLLVLLAFLAIFLFGLAREPDTLVRSRLIGQPVPDFALEPALAGHPGFTSAELRKGEPRLINIFASWCVPCVAEAPQLLALKRRGIPIDAIAIRDRPEDIAEFLRRHGDPYARIGVDPVSRVQLAFGSSGVPETFVVDGRGIVRYQHIGDIRPENVPEIVAAFEAAK